MVASFADIVTVSFVTTVSIGSVPAKVKVPPVLNESVPVSPARLNEDTTVAQERAPLPSVCKN